MAAIKVIEKFRHATELELIKQEAAVMRLLKDCNHVVKLIDTYETDDRFCFVMECINGGELFNKIVSKGFYSEADGAFLIKQILDGIAYMHERNLVHRDLKPENLLCATSDPDQLSDVKLSDFGLAREVPPGTTLTGRYGSPQYMAPEIWLKKPYGLKVDMWSLGIISYILLGGYFPFRESANDPPLEVQVVKGAYDFNEDSWTDVSNVAKDFIKKLLVVDPEKRMSAQEALNHPFFNSTKSKQSTTNRAFVLAKIKRFNARRKFKSAVLAIITTNRMQHILSVTTKIKEEWRKSVKPLSPKDPVIANKKPTSGAATPTTPSKSEDNKKSASSSPLDVRLFVNTDRALITEVRQLTVQPDNTIVIHHLPKHIMGSTLFFRTIENSELDVIQTKINMTTQTITLKLRSVPDWKTNYLQLFYGTSSSDVVAIHLFHGEDSLLTALESKKLSLKIGYNATFNEDMSTVTLTGIYNLINRSGRSYNAACVTLEQFTDSSLDLKEPLLLPDNEDINIQFLPPTELEVTQEETTEYVAKILTDSSIWYVKAPLILDNVKNMWSGGVTLYVCKNKKKKPATTDANSAPPPSMVYVASGWLTTKGEEEHAAAQRNIRNKKVTKSDSAKRLVRLYSARQVRATVDGAHPLISERTKSARINSKEVKSKEKDKEKKKEKKDKSL